MPNLRLIARKIVAPFRYAFAKLTGRPYFGLLLDANQMAPARRPAMKALIEHELAASSGRDMRILEVGTWAGESARLWAEACRRHGRGKVFCIDTWMASPNAPERMKRATRNNAIFKLFLYNFDKAGLRDWVCPLLGTSDCITAVLRPDAFDFVYIDGDHSYSQVKRDLLNCGHLLRGGGVLCGDDLELQSSEIDVGEAELRREEDYILDPRTKRHFHPGVTVAVRDVLGEVSALNGFYAMRKSASGWEKIDLSGGTIQT